VPGQISGDGPCTGTTDVSDCPYHFFRTSKDIRANWNSMHGNLMTTRKFQGDVPLSRPGSWAYPDMMEVGRMATVEEDRSHFGAWVITSSPLILGYDLNDESITDKIWDIISNREAIAIHQTWAGHPGRQVKTWVPPSPPPVAGMNVYAVSCDSADNTQRNWSYDSANKAIRGPGGKCLDAQGGKADAQSSKVGDQFSSLFLNDCDGSDLQQFTIGDDGTIDSVMQKGKCLDIWAGHGTPGGPGIQLYSCHGVANEKFTFEDDGSVSSQGQLCLAGRAAVPVHNGELELWAKPLGDGKVAAFVLNNGNHVVTDFDLADLNMTGDVSVRDVWARQDLPALTGGSIPLELDLHGSAMFILTPQKAVALV